MNIPAYDFDEFGENDLPWQLRSAHFLQKSNGEHPLPIQFVRKKIYDAPDWYDVDYAGYRGDVAFYHRIFAEVSSKKTLSFHAGDDEDREDRADRVVELGAGTGRLTLELLRSGARVHAVEPSAMMRAVLQEKIAAHGFAHACDVEDSDAGAFAGPLMAPSLVLFSFNGLLHLRTRSALHEAFQRIYQKLAYGGVFAFDVTSPYWESMRRGSTPWGRVDERVHPHTGAKLLTCDRSAYNAETRTMHIFIRYVDVVANQGIEFILEQRMWTWQEIFDAVVQNGFTPGPLYGDVNFARFQESSPRMLMVAQKRR